jgi:hypothetical protein
MDTCLAWFLCRMTDDHSQGQPHVLDTIYHVCSHSRWMMEKDTAASKEHVEM